MSFWACVDIISIHALREEGDQAVFCYTDPRSISIHALREEGDILDLLKPTEVGDFYPRPPRGGRHLEVSCWP